MSTMPDEVFSSNNNALELLLSFLTLVTTKLLPFKGTMESCSSRMMTFIVEGTGNKKIKENSGTVMHPFFSPGI